MEQGGSANTYPKPSTPSPPSIRRPKVDFEEEQDFEVTKVVLSPPPLPRLPSQDPVIILDDDEIEIIDDTPAANDGSKSRPAPIHIPGRGVGTRSEALRQEARQQAGRALVPRHTIDLDAIPLGGLNVRHSLFNHVAKRKREDAIPIAFSDSDNDDIRPKKTPFVSSPTSVVKTDLVALKRRRELRRRQRLEAAMNTVDFDSDDDGFQMMD